MKQHEGENMHTKKVIKKLNEGLQVSEKLIKDRIEDRYSYQIDQNRRNNLKIIGLEERSEVKLGNRQRFKSLNC